MVNSPTRNPNPSCIASNPPVSPSLHTGKGTEDSKRQKFDGTSHPTRSNQGPTRPINSNRSSDEPTRRQLRPTAEWKSASLKLKPCELSKQAKLRATHPRHEMRGEGDAHQHRIPKPHQIPQPPAHTPTHAKDRAKRTVLPLAAAAAPPPRCCWYRSNAAPATGADDILLCPPAPAPALRRLRSAAPALRQPLHWIRCSRSRRRSGAPRRGGGGRGLGFGFWAAGLCGGRRRRRRRRRGGGGGTAREEGGEESDRDGSAVNAMAAMALSVFPLSPTSSCGWPALEPLRGEWGGLLSTLSVLSP